MVADVFEKWIGEADIDGESDSDSHQKVRIWLIGSLGFNMACKQLPHISSQLNPYIQRC